MFLFEFITLLGIMRKLIDALKKFVRNIFFLKKKLWEKKKVIVFFFNIIFYIFHKYSSLMAKPNMKSQPKQPMCANWHRWRTSFSSAFRWRSPQEATKLSNQITS